MRSIYVNVVLSEGETENADFYVGRLQEGMSTSFDSCTSGDNVVNDENVLAIDQRRGGETKDVFYVSLSFAMEKVSLCRVVYEAYERSRIYGDVRHIAYALGQTFALIVTSFLLSLLG